MSLQGGAFVSGCQERRVFEELEEGEDPDEVTNARMNPLDLGLNHKSMAEDHKGQEVLGIKLLKESQIMSRGEIEKEKEERTHLFPWIFVSEISEEENFLLLGRK